MPTKKLVNGATKTKQAIATPTNAGRMVKVKITPGTQRPRTVKVKITPGTQRTRTVRIKRLPDTPLITLFKRQAEALAPKKAKEKSKLISIDQAAESLKWLHGIAAKDTPAGAQARVVVGLIRGLQTFAQKCEPAN